MPRILLLYNAPTLPAEHPDAVSEADVLHTVDAVESVLTGAGHQIERLGLAMDPAPLLEAVKVNRPDAVFNLFEGTAVLGSTEATVAGLLEWLGIPFTGCPAASMVLARDKALTKRLLRGAGLPTAEFVLVEAEQLANPPQPATWPVFVKPVNEDASVGIEQSSVVQTPAELTARLRFLASRYRPPFLVETYLDGREFNLGVIDNPEPLALPVAEIVFDESVIARGAPRTPALPLQGGGDQTGGGSRKWYPIVTYRSKWEPGSDEDLAALPKCPADVDSALATRLQELALAAYRLTSCRDYARIDCRTNVAGEPFILEVNPNPDFSPTAGLARAITASGRTWEGFAREMVGRVAATPGSTPAPLSRRTP